jgi:hypothetical protein
LVRPAIKFHGEAITVGNLALAIAARTRLPRFLDWRDRMAAIPVGSEPSSARFLFSCAEQLDALDLEQPHAHIVAVLVPSWRKRLDAVAKRQAEHAAREQLSFEQETRNAEEARAAAEQAEAERDWPARLDAERGDAAATRLRESLRGSYRQHRDYEFTVWHPTPASEAATRKREPAALVSNKMRREQALGVEIERRLERGAPLLPYHNALSTGVLVRQREKAWRV